MSPLKYYSKHPLLFPSLQYCFYQDWDRHFNVFNVLLGLKIHTVGKYGNGAGFLKIYVPVGNQAILVYILVKKHTYSGYNIFKVDRIAHADVGPLGHKWLDVHTLKAA